MISNTIENLRKEKNISVADIAKNLDITVQGYYKIIKKNDFKISQLQKIAEILSVDVSYFVNDSTMNILLEFLSTGLTKKNIDTEENPIYHNVFNYIRQQYFDYLFSYLAEVICSFGKDEAGLRYCVYDSNSNFIRDPNNVIIAEINTKLENFKVGEETKEKFLSNFDKNNDKFTDCIYTDYAIIYLLGKGYINHVLLSKVLFKTLLNASDFC